MASSRGVAPPLLLQELPRGHFGRALVVVAAAATGVIVVVVAVVGAIVVVAAVIVVIVHIASIAVTVVVAVGLALVSRQRLREHHPPEGIRSVDHDHRVLPSHRGMDGYLGGRTCVMEIERGEG